MKHLFFFTVNYPFQHGEHLVENELKFLKKHFNRITIICNSNSTDIKYEVPESIAVVHMNTNLSFAQKLSGFLEIFNVLFWQELWIVIVKYKRFPSIQIIHSLLSSLNKGKYIKLKLNKLFASERNSGYDIYCYSWWVTIMTIGFTLLKREDKDIRICSRARAVDVYFEQNKANYLPLRYFIYSNLEKAFFISEQGRRYTLNKLGGLISGTTFNIFRMGTLQENQVVFEVSEKSNYRIVSCSNIIPLKRINLIIDSLKQIVDYDVEWIHFGTGFLEEEMIKYAAYHLKEKRNIKFEFKGYITNKELLKFYATNFIDLFINVSTTEGIPVSIMEAYSFGIPSVATDVGGVKEIVTADNGFLLQKDCTSEMISGKILEYINMEKNRKKELRKNAFKTWEKDFNLKNNFEMISKEISKI